MNILLLRVGRLGDMVMVAPAIRYLLDTHPKAQFTLITSADGARLYRNFDPRLNEMWVFRKSNPGRRLSRLELARWLKTRSFDRKYCLETDERHHRILAAVPGETIVMTAPTTASFGHYSLDCLQLVGHPNPPAYRPVLPLFPVTMEGERKASELLTRLGINAEDIVVGLNPTFSAARRLFRRKAKASKRWPAASWAQLADGLTEWGEQAGVRVKTLIDVLPQETGIAREIATLSRRGILISRDSPDMARYKALLQRMNLFIAPDTGTMHLAATMGTPLVALYSTSNPEITGPLPLYKERFAIVRATDEYPTLHRIPVDRVLKSAGALLNAYRSDKPRATTTRKELPLTQ